MKSPINKLNWHIHHPDASIVLVYALRRFVHNTLALYQVYLSDDNQKGVTRQSRNLKCIRVKQSMAIFGNL